ncbi:MAG: hypothetical protein WCJ81_06790 [bacterium]
MKRSLKILGFVVPLLFCAGCSYEPPKGYDLRYDTEEYSVYESKNKDSVEVAIKSMVYGPTHIDLNDSVPSIKGRKRFGTDVIVALKKGQVYTVTNANQNLEKFFLVLWTGLLLIIGSTFGKRKR